MFVTETEVMSAWVMVYVAVQVTVAVGARVVFASPQFIGVGLMRLALTVNWAGPRFTVPLFLMTYVNVIFWPTRL